MQKRERWLAVIAALLVVGAAVIGGILGARRGKAPSTKKVAVLSYSKDKAFMGPAPGTSILETALLHINRTDPLQTLQQPTTTSITTFATTSQDKEATTVDASSSTAPTRANSGPGSTKMRGGLLSTLIDKVLGRYDEDDNTDSDVWLFDSDLFDSSSIERVVIPRPWKALEEASPLRTLADDAAQGLTGLATCYPKNGSEIEKAVMGKDCTIIQLTRGYFEPYRLNNTLIVNTTKIIMGNPLALPAIIPSKKMERVFHVVAGGHLVFQSLAVYRAHGRRIGVDKSMRLSQGSTGIVELGGTFHAIGVWFRENPQTREMYLNNLNDTVHGRGAVRTFGGHVMVRGGTLRLTGCVTHNYRPYGNPAFNTFAMAGDFLVLAGNAVFLGCWHVNINAYMVTTLLGNAVSVQLGNVIWIGGGNVMANGMMQQAGAGFQTYVGGGVMVLVGWNLVGFVGTLSRSGLGVFNVDAGVLIKIGFEHFTNFGVRYSAQAGLYTFVGSGAFVLIGGSSHSVMNCQGHYGTGYVHVGSGSSTTIGYPQYRAQVVQSMMGAGFARQFVGAGSVVEVGVPHYQTRVAGAVFGAGSDVFLGGGDMVVVANYRCATMVFNVFLGTGNQVFVGGGIAVFMRNWGINFLKWSYSSTPYTYTVGGYGAGRAASFGLLVMPNQGKRIRTPEPIKRVLEDTSLPALPDKSTLLVEGDAFYESRADLASINTAIVNARHQGLKGMRKGAFSAYDVVQSVMNDPNIKQDWVPTGKIKVNNTNCVICDVKPGGTTSHIPNLPDQCFGTDMCGATINDTLNIASAAAMTAQHQEMVQGVREGLKEKAAYWDQYKHLGEVITDPMTGAKRLRHLQEDGRYDSSLLPNAYFLKGRVTVFCRYRDPSRNSNTIYTNCSSQAVVKSLMKAYITTDLVGPADVTTPEHLVKPFLVDQINPLYYEELRPSSFPPSCDGYSNYDFYLTTVDQGAWTQAQARYDDLRHDTESLVLALESATNSLDIEVCGVRLGESMAQSFGHYERSDTYNPSDSIISPGVSVAEKQDPVPVTTIYPDQSYILYAYNFPRASTVAIKLLDNTSRPVPEEVFTSYKIKNFDDSAPTALTWRIPSQEVLDGLGLILPSKYYFIATTPGITTFSQALSLQKTGTPKRRHLFA